MYHLHRGIDLYACMLGTMRAGAAFTIAETDIAPERAEFVRRDSGWTLFVDEQCMKEIHETDPLDGYEPVDPHSLL